MDRQLQYLSKILDELIDLRSMLRAEIIYNNYMKRKEFEQKENKDEKENINR